MVLRQSAHSGFRLRAADTRPQQKTPRQALGCRGVWVSIVAGRVRPRGSHYTNHEPPPPPSSDATLVNVAFAFVPIERIAVKQTITIRASITAYSTAVGPSSEARKRCTFVARFFIASSDTRVGPLGTYPTRLSGAVLIEICSRFTTSDDNRAFGRKRRGLPTVVHRPRHYKRSAKSTSVGTGIHSIVNADHVSMMACDSQHPFGNSATSRSRR